MAQAHVKLFMASNSPHIHQVAAGFLSLQEEERLNVTFINGNSSYSIPDLPHKHCVVAYVEGKTIIFDMSDGYSKR